MTQKQHHFFETIQSAFRLKNYKMRHGADANALAWK